MEAPMAPDEITEDDEGPSHPFFPGHVIDQLIQFYLWIGIVTTLALLVPIGLHEKADPLVTPEGIKPEWYFLSMYQALKYVPKIVGVTAGGVAALLFIIWPFLDSLLEGRFPGKRMHRKVGAFALVVMVLLALLGRISENTVTVGSETYEFDLRAVPHRLTPEQVEELKAKKAKSKAAPSAAEAKKTTEGAKGPAGAKKEGGAR